MKKCTIYYSRKDAVSRIMTGFNLLERYGIINVHFKENLANFRKVPSSDIIEVEVDDKIIAFDMGDKWALCDEEGLDYLQRVDILHEIIRTRLT